MKVLVIVTNYPSEKVKIGLMYIHTRNLYYVKNSIDVTVLNFSAKESYEWDGINVLCLKDYCKLEGEFDILISHAPNIRNHYQFLKKYEVKFKTIVFFFHGHEVLFNSKVYSKPYRYLKKNNFKIAVGNIYDRYKLSIWRRYLPQIAEKSYFIFVSLWMLNEFQKWVKLNENDLRNHISITYNSIGEFFEMHSYNRENEKQYDFVTIRGNLDGSKYCVDIVCKLAEKFPQYKFLLIGKGKFFEYHTCPENVEWKEIYCDHNEIIKVLNQSRCALMPTRTDAQGLMSCEMATFGIPLITSDIPVCHEIFDTFSNVEFISNDVPDKQFLEKYDTLIQKVNLEKNKKYFATVTVENEIKLFKKIMEE